MYKSQPSNACLHFEGMLNLFLHQRQDRNCRFSKQVPAAVLATVRGCSTWVSKHG
jgi:hypothetical protein